MMPRSESSVEPDEVQRRLIKAGLIKSRTKIRLEGYPAAYVRQSQARRWNYRVTTGDRVVCHLVAGLALAEIHHQANEFWHARPDLVCQPLLFWESADGTGFLCLEHFDGRSLDALVGSGDMTADKWTETVRRAEALLVQTTRPSTSACFQEEVHKVLAEANSLPGLTPIDAGLLNDLVRPVLLKAANSASPVAQWTNGDFTGGNLLINEKGEIRLIDYEYAQLTHFRSADWLRLAHFSVLPPGLDLEALPELRAARQPAQELHFWVSHLAHLQHVEMENESKDHRSEVIGRLFQAFALATSGGAARAESSLILRALAERQIKSDAVVKQRTEWAGSLERDLQAARVAHDAKTAEALERTTWARQLEAEIAETRVLLDERTRDATERTLWAQTMEADLVQTRTLLAQRSQELDERTKWARAMEADLSRMTSERNAQFTMTRSLEKDLGDARQHFDNLTREHAERTAWAKSLEGELDAAKVKFAELTAAYDERTAWAKTLQQDVQAHAARLLELTAAHEERTAWALDLQRELRVHAARIAELKVLNEALVAKLEAVEVEKSKILRELKVAQYGCLATQRDLLAKEAALRQVMASKLEAQTEAQALTQTGRRLEAAISRAQHDVDRLLLQFNEVQRAAKAEREKAKATLESHRASIDQLEATSARLRAELNRYESSALSRYFARSSKSPSSAPSA